MLIQSYTDEDECNQAELIKNLAKEHMMWTHQAFELLHTFRDQGTYVKIVPFLMNRIKDRHMRFSLV